jgi:uncharacterized repeat protein (TIGR03843 family)
MPPAERSPSLSEDLLRLLRTGTLSVEGRLVDASNATLYCTVGGTTACVYKPVRGERPLWDFPDGTLAGREVATYLVSEATGWGLVPPTVLREGPFGPGMCQVWIDVVDGVDLRELAGSDHVDLQRMALLDAVVNNADRKGGHLLPTAEGRVLGVDHGVCFSTDDKLRTLLWQWAGEPLSAEGLEALHQLRAALTGSLCEELSEHLTRREVRATAERVERLLLGGCYPFPSEDWPAIPWPPF